MATIKAKRWWNRTIFRLEKGRRYRFSANGTWRDASHECDATGFTARKLRFFEWSRRKRDAKWFSLIGSIDKTRSTQFDIGRLLEANQVYTAPKTGQLYCFANDAWLMYLNNKGSVDLEVTPADD